MPRLDPLQLAPVVIAAAAYAARVRTLRGRGRRVPAWRVSCFATGVALLLVALASPIDTIGEEHLFWVHMVQHLLLGDLAPLALVLGLTGPILRPVLALPGVGRLRVLAHPAVALPLWIVVFFGWHLRVLYQAALAHDALHALEHVSFFWAGVLAWVAVIEPVPGPAWFGNGAKAAFTLALRAAGAVLANVFIWAGTPLYPRYGHVLSDQEIAGALMFVEGAVVGVVAFGVLFLAWTREAEQRQRLLEAGHDPARALRAARHGRSPLGRGSGA